MIAVQSGGKSLAEKLPDEIRAVAWNLERALFPKESANHLKNFIPDVVLLSELDHGMALTAQRHNTEIIARELDMSYIYGVEFHELDLGGPTERVFCKDDFNARGWHGNAILSRAPFHKVAMVRLDDHGHWFSAGEFNTDPAQPRVGGRMALLATVSTQSGTMCLVSTHLESNADEAYRERQFERLMDAVDEFAPNLPVLIGGDLNTGNNLPPLYDWRKEGLFDAARARGYDWGFTADGHTTRPSLISPNAIPTLKLDWICGRGASPRETAIIPSITKDNKPLSDYDAVWCKFVI